MSSNCCRNARQLCWRNFKMTCAEAPNPNLAGSTVTVKPVITPVFLQWLLAGRTVCVSNMHLVCERSDRYPSVFGQGSNNLSVYRFQWNRVQHVPVMRHSGSKSSEEPTSQFQGGSNYRYFPTYCPQF